MSYGGNMSNIGKKGKIDKKKFPKKFETPSNIGKRGKITEVEILSN